LPSLPIALCIALRIVLNASQNGKGLCFVVVVFAIVFLPLSMGLDLDCCVPYPAPSPKKFTVFRGSGNLESLGKPVCGGSRNVLPRTGEYQH
jgi:hypothetical protein